MYSVPVGPVWTNGNLAQHDPLTKIETARTDLSAVIPGRRPAAKPLAGEPGIPMCSSHTEIPRHSKWSG